MSRCKPLLAAFFLLGLAACGEAAGTGSSTSSSSALAVGGGDAGTSSSTTAASAATAAPAATATPVPTPAPTPVPTPPPTPEPTAAPTAAPVADTCGAPQNPWGYNFCSGSTISSPPSSFCSYFSCISNFWNGRGYVEQCRDGMFSKSGGISGSCSYHGGNQQALLQR